MTEVHPTYYHDAGLWEIGRLREPTLRALAAALPRGTTIRDYHPAGYREQITWPEGSTRKAMPMKNVPTLLARQARLKGGGTAAQRAAGASRRRYDHDAILDAWRELKSARLVSDRCGLDDPASVLNIVNLGRKRGDPRAVRVGKGFNRFKAARLKRDAAPATAPHAFRWTPEAVSVLVAGRFASPPVTFDALGAQLGTSRNSVSSMWERLRPTLPCAG